MNKSKIILISSYVAIAVLIGLFVFGDSGILDNMSKSQEIVSLTSAIQKSKAEIDEMTKEYNRLLSMKEPTQAFLIDQGRKSKDIVVFKTTPSSDSEDDSLSTENDKKLFFIISVMSLIILLLGCAGIAYINFKHKKEETSDV